MKHGNYHLDSSSSMKCLPLHLLDDILFRLEPKSLAMIRCTNRYFKSYIFDNPMFEIESSSRVIPRLFYVNNFSTINVYCKPLDSSCDAMSEANFQASKSLIYKCFIFGSCSGLVLLYIGGLFVVNPLTKRFRFLDHSASKLLPTIVDRYVPDFIPHCFIGYIGVGFVVNRTTKKFKIVCILEMQTVYGFEISDGDSWRLSKTTITTSSKSDLIMLMNPVYVDDTLHWLRNDGSVITFNPETEQARFIPSTFPQEVPDTVVLLAADGRTNRLTLISGTKETISVYTLFEDLKWTLDMQIKNVLKDSILVGWDILAYDGMRLVVKGWKRLINKDEVHLYDMEANSWRVLGSSSTYFVANVWNAYKFTPSFFPVEEDAHNYKAIVASNDPRISYLTAVMRIIGTTK